MSRLPTSLARESHAYTRSKMPWLITIGETAYGKMINYISGGGMRTFGRTMHQEETLRRQRKFVALAVVLAALWLVFYIF